MSSWSSSSACTEPAITTSIFPPSTLTRAPGPRVRRGLRRCASMSDRVRLEIDGAVRTVTLARPEKGNAMDVEMLRDLEAAFDPAPGPGPAERVAVIRADGRVFCAGLDLRGDLGKDQDVELLFHRVETWPLPVVAVVQGAAIAGGNELPLHCDIVV